jgi:hypothetical protein
VLRTVFSQFAAAQVRPGISDIATKARGELVRKTQVYRIGSFLLFSVLILGCSGLAEAQNISVSPKLIPFPNQGIGTSSGASSVTLLNNQSGTLTITSIQTSAPYSETDNCGTGLAANQQCTINVTFSPTAKGYFSSSLTITDSAGNSPQTVSLTGNGVIPVTFSPGILNFPNQPAGTTSNASTVTVSNNLSAALPIANITATAPFAQTNNCGTSIAAGGSCTLSLTFDPTAVQSYTSTVAITDSDPSSPQTFAVTGSGVAPVTYSPKLIAFPNQPTSSTSSSYPITVTNVQSTALTISSIVSPAPYAQTNNCGTSLAANQQCTINVTFSPTAKGYFSSSLTITDSAENSPQTVTLTGNGFIPVTFSPTVLNFPNQSAGTTSNASTVTVSNNLSAALPIANITATAPFAQTNNCGTSIAAGGSCTLSLTFDPAAVQSYTSTVAITDSDPSSPQTFAVTGSGVAPVTYTPKLITFPNQPINSTSSSYPITVTNDQSTALTISSIVAPAPYAQTNNCGTSLAAGQSCTVNVAFSPTAVSYYSSSLTIADSSATSPHTVALAGSGFLPVRFSPLVISFPQQAIGTTSSGYSVTVTNEQSGALSISSIQTSAPFSETNNCGTSLAAGQSCTVTVTISPTAVKYYSSTLTITDNATNSPQTIGLGGNGVIPVSITPPVGGLYFDHQIVSTPSTPQPVTLTNNLAIPLTFTSMSSSAEFPFATNCGNGQGGGALASGATCTIQISFDPQTVTSYSTNLTINENAPGSPLLIPLQGAGIVGTPGNTVTVKPGGACIAPNETEQFTAYVTGLTNTAVNWRVNGKPNGNATVGTISPAGFYTAPSTTGSYSIAAVTQSTPSITFTTSISVTNSPTYEIYPFVASIPVGAQQTFQAQECGVPDTGNVSFTVDNIAGGNSTVGTVSSSGVYTAPATAGKHTVRAIDSTLNKSSGGVVTVFSSITADFGSRANTTAPVPANMFGYGRGESIATTAGRNLLTQGGLTVSRMSAQINPVFASTTPNWKMIDPLITTVQAAGQRAILQMNQSPAWLQPTSGSCEGNAFAAPTNIAEWVQIAVQYVAHMDSTFPGVVQDYEIWNEPNATGLCTSADHLNTYIAIYAAAAPAMKAQAAADGTTIRIGGPVLSGYSALWFSTLLTNASTAPYVDFVSYHQYFFGSTQLQVKWDTNTGDMSLYEATQDPSVGAAGVYGRVAAEVAAGTQPLGAKTPIYVTEYNSNWSFFQDCCRSNPTYAPVFNALYVTDMLDTVYNGISQVPNSLDYFAGSAYPWFCLIGVQDTNMDCLYSVDATPVPYPQYYAYDLIASPEYLGLSAGGYMAKSISTPTGGGGLATTAFYTANQDAIVITNPTSTAYPAITVTFANPGLTGTQGTLYQIVNGAQIDTSPISFTVQGTSLSTTISVPAYSVQVISLP